MYDSLLFEYVNIKQFVFCYLKAKLNNEWISIDLHNHRIIPPNKEEENLLLMKAFFDMGHQGMANYFVLTNPTGTKVKNAIDLSGSYSDYEFEVPRIEYMPDGIMGGKTLVYDNYLRKVVDESLYDSIWLITTEVENDNFRGDRVYETYYQYFNWSNNRHLQDMITSYSYVTIPYFLIFKNGLHAIISDNGNILVPFTKEEIDVSRRNIKREKTSGNMNGNSGKSYELVYEYVFSTFSNTYLDYR
jgi:hypothetical protein